VSEVVTVGGSIEAPGSGACDAHCHLWIAPAPEGSPRLADARLAGAELENFAAAGGALVIDCQPVAAGRDGGVLAALMERTGVAIVSCTGYHLRRHYRPGEGPWERPVAALDLFEAELADGLAEAPGLRAGAVKAAWSGGRGAEGELMRAALEAAARAGAPLVVHTEAGLAVERLAELVRESELPPRAVQLSHVDRRPDAGLHAELAREGFLLGYDTFLRPRQGPEERLWPLLLQMVGCGLWRSVCAGLDLVDAARWAVSGGPGLRAIPTDVAARLRREGAPEEAVTAISGGNALRLLTESAERSPA
jgi:5-phospho-D-xylono-1,4-lactonase